MTKARQQARRKGKWREKRTPQPKEQEEEEEVPVIGSSCTWRDAELEQFKVRVKRDVDVREMIPEKYFDFDHLPDYIDCIVLV